MNQTLCTKCGATIPDVVASKWNGLCARCASVENPASRFGRVTAVVLLLVGGILFVAFGTWIATVRFLHDSSITWIPTEAAVVDATVLNRFEYTDESERSFEGPIRSVFHVALNLKYIADAKEFITPPEADLSKISVGRYYTHAEALSNLPLYPPGTKIRIFFQAQQPSEYVIGDPPNFHRHFYMALILIVMGFLGIGTSIALLRWNR